MSSRANPSRLGVVFFPAVVDPWVSDRAAPDQDGLREQLDPEDVPVSVRQLLLVLLLHRLLQRQSRGLSWTARLHHGEVP